MPAHVLYYDMDVCYWAIDQSENDTVQKVGILQINQG